MADIEMSIAMMEAVPGEQDLANAVTGFLEIIMIYTHQDCLADRGRGLEVGK